MCIDMWYEVHFTDVIIEAAGSEYSLGNNTVVYNLAFPHV